MVILRVILTIFFRINLNGSDVDSSARCETGQQYLQSSQRSYQLEERVLYCIIFRFEDPQG